MKKWSLILWVFATTISFWNISEHINAANTLASNGYIVDQSSDTTKYNTDKRILRQEAIGVITKVNGLIWSADSGYVCQNKFLDVSANDGWVCYVAENAANNDIVNPNNARFRPKDNMTRYEAMILAFKWSCIQPIGDWRSTDNALEHVRIFALNTGVLTDPGLNIDYPASRGEFFTYIVRAQNYKVTHPEIIDASLPGCISFRDINFTEISLKAPDSMIKLIEEGEEGIDEYYGDYNTNTVLSLSVSSANGLTDLWMINSLFMKESPEYEFLQEYSFRWWRILVFNWQEANSQLKLKAYYYSIIKNGYIYGITYFTPVDSDKETESIRNTIFNSVQILPPQDINF